MRGRVLRSFNYDRIRRRRARLTSIPRRYDPHGVAAGGMYADCDGCRSRDWFGPNPWSEPGTAKHLDFIMGGTGGNILGVCGASPSQAVRESMSRRFRSSLG